MANDEISRLSVKINAECKAALTGYSERHNITVTETVRQAISLLHFIDEKSHDGHSVTLQKGDVRTELMIP